MSITVASNRFITSSLKGLYGYLTYHLSSFQALGERLIHEAETIQAFRQTEKLEELGLILSNFPIKEYRLAGQFYIGWSINRKGHDAQELFEKVVEESNTYRARALIDLGSRQARKGYFSSSIPYYTEALKYSQNTYTIVQAERSIAAAKGVEGYHIKALKDLKRIAPLVRYSPPIERLQYLNSLAIELAKVGRVEEARNVCQITLASPFAFAYPEWRETGQEIEQKSRRASRSVVAVSKKIIQRKIKETSNQQSLATYEQKIELDSNLLPFRRRQPIHPQIPLYSHLETTGNQYTTGQKRSLIVDIVSHLNEVSLDRLFALAMELDEPQSRRPRQIDLEEKGTLETLMSLWTSGDLDPNDHVAVLSALRDCDNNLRFKNIINEMITYIFRFTQERMQGESFWRKRVEAQLTPETD